MGLVSEYSVLAWVSWIRLAQITQNSWPDLVKIVQSFALIIHGIQQNLNDEKTRLHPPFSNRRQAMRSDSLPSPLNIPQELVSHLFWRNTERAKELFARGMFWLITGPVAIAATAVLWAMSLPLTLAWTVRVLRSYGPSMIVPSILGISFNLGIAPLMTALLWLYGVAGIWRQGDGVTEVRLSRMESFPKSRIEAEDTQAIYWEYYVFHLTEVVPH